jgi:purine-cytosine permease-like protein
MAYTDPAGNRIAVYSLGIAPAVSISGKSAVNNGTVLDGLTVRSAAVISVTTSSGVSAGAVQLQGSLDSTNWFNLGSAISTTAASSTTQTVVSSAYARYFRAAITTAITGGSVTVSVGVSG